MPCSTPGFPDLHNFLEFSQTHVHWVSNAIQQSHPLSSPSSHAFNLSQHQGLFQRVSSSPWVAKVLELQHQSFQRISISIDWFDLFAVQETLKSLFQHHSLKAQFFISQWSRSRFIIGIPLLFLWPNRCFQFDLWFLCLF